MPEDAFASYHPAVNFIWFGLVLALTMCLRHPVCLAVSLFAAAAYGARLYGGKKTRRAALALLPAALFAAALNPAFSHEGATILAYFPSGNPLTLESVEYGFAAAAMLAAAAIWFSCLNAVMTSDKFVWLAGRALPALSLALSMTLRFVPRFRARMKAVAGARRQMGRGCGGAAARAKESMAVFSAVVTWSLEHAADTADSMKSRGYGLPGRTAFSVYRFGKRDARALAAALITGGFTAAGAAAGWCRWRYYPVAAGAGAEPLTLCVFAAYAALCLLPLFIDRLDAGRRAAAADAK